MPRLSFAWVIALSILTLARIFAAVPAAGPGRFPKGTGRAKAGDGGWDAEKRKPQGFCPLAAFVLSTVGKNHAAL